MSNFARITYEGKNMKIKSLYIAAQEKNAGTLFVSMGMMELLKRNFHRVAFFRPIIASREHRDGDISFIFERYKLIMKYEDAFVYDVAEVETLLAQGKEKEMLENIIFEFKQLEEHYDFVLCEGIRKSFLTSTIEYDVNIKIAQNLGAPYINVLNAKGRSVREIYEDVCIEDEAITKEGCIHFATFVNRIGATHKQELAKCLEHLNFTTYLLEEVEELNRVSVADIMESLDAKSVVLGKYDPLRTIKKVKIAALSLENFLDHIEEDDLIIVPADRSEIILALYGALHSESYANISAIVFPLNMNIHPNIAKLIEGLSGFKIPILSVASDTFETAKQILQVHARLRINSERKIALALGLFYANVDVEAIEQKLQKTVSDIVTPQMFEYRLYSMAHKQRKTIVLPEATDERILRAAEIVLRREIADIVLLGDAKQIREHSLRLGLNIEKATIVNPLESEYFEEFAEKFYNLRKAKGVSRKQADESMADVNYFATMMLFCGYVDGMVSGAAHTTADTIRPALEIIKTQEGVSLVSSLFFMCFETKVLVYADCAINENPNASELADIAIASADTARTFGIEPKVVMLSYATGESAKSAEVQKVREATQIVKEKRNDILVEGPIQYDAAISKEVAKVKLPNSKVAGEATVFIFPDLNTGNNTYKAVQRSSGAVAIGPILQGLKKPVNDLSRGCMLEDVVNTIAITAIQAGGSA
jgi:phosphate acetyltransferase